MCSSYSNFNFYKPIYTHTHELVIETFRKECLLFVKQVEFMDPKT